MFANGTPHKGKATILLYYLKRFKASSMRDPQHLLHRGGEQHKTFYAYK